MAVKLKVEHVSKIFGRHPEAVLKKLEQGASKEKVAKETGHTIGVHDVSFDVNQGEIFVIMGLSGSGKSTLIRCLNLLNKPTGGKIYVDDEEITAYNKKQLSQFRQEKVSMVFQHFGILSHRTVLTNVEYGLEVKGMAKAEREKLAMKSLETVGLAGWETKMPDELSGGMQQRVGLARALATEPEILLMDEPFSALDPLIRREIQQELLDIQAKLRKTIIFITHDVNEAFKLGDRVAVMKDGQMVQIGTPEDILANPANEYIEEFVQDIDRSKVLQAKNVMFKPTAIISLKDPLKLAIKEMRDNGISSLFVLDHERKLQGIVTIDDAIRSNKENKTLKDILRLDYETADPEAYLQDLIPKATDSKFPIAVIDDSNKFQGIILRVSVLSALI
jgi:glycine betaine/proline transport system ATP-binding protein